jgi:alpha-tubulin suppressor-like RCC1 family protein
MQRPCPAGACDLGSGCGPDGTECDDHDACTLGDRCQGGTCVGTPKLCGGPAACVSATTLNPGGGVCVDGECSGSPEVECVGACAAGACTSTTKMVGVSWHAACALSTGGAVACWGDNTLGALGTGNTTSSLVPVVVPGLETEVVALSAGGNDDACALTAEGRVSCWGGGYDDLGTIGSLSPLEVSLPVPAVAITTGPFHRCALTGEGEVYCWGNNFACGLGDPAKPEPVIIDPVKVLGLAPNIVAISAGLQFTCAVSAAGGVQCWGVNGYGQLGLETAFGCPPVDVPGLTQVISVAAGSSRVCALTQAGAVLCWGLDSPIGSAEHVMPEVVTGLWSGVESITSGNENADTGEDHDCALFANGKAKCWGGNHWGQLGDGTTTPSLGAVDVVGLSARTISAGIDSTCAIELSGRVVCWGRGTEGQLGNGTMMNSLTPVPVMGL